MTEIYIFDKDDENNEYGSMGLAGGPLIPTECTFSETKNGESVLTMTHPLDEYGRYKTLETGRILVVPVPVYNYGGISSDYEMDNAENIIEPVKKKTFTSKSGAFYEISGTFTAAVFSQTPEDVTSEISSGSFNFDKNGTLSFFGVSSGFKVYKVAVPKTNVFSSKTGNVDVAKDTDYAISGTFVSASFAADSVKIDVDSLKNDHIWESLGDGTVTFTTSKTDISVIPIAFPMILNGRNTATSYLYRVARGTNDKTRTIWSKSKNGKKKKVVPAVDKKTNVPNRVHVISILDSDLHKDINHPYKVQFDKYTGYMSADGLEETPEVTYLEGASSSAMLDTQSRWKVKDQLFRIYEVDKGLDSVKVSARHISYDLMYNLTKYYSEGEVPFIYAARSIISKNNVAAEHPFHVYTNLMDKRAGLSYYGNNPINAFLDQKNGLCALYHANIVRDNFDLVFFNDTPQNRGVTLQYGRNLTGINYKISSDEMITRVIPIAKTKSGAPLYLDTATIYKAPTKSDYGYASLSAYRTYIFAYTTKKWHSIWFQPSTTGAAGYWLYHEDSSKPQPILFDETGWRPVDASGKPCDGKVTFNYNLHLDYGKASRKAWTSASSEDPVGVTVCGTIYIDSPNHSKDYSTPHCSQLDCSSYKEGEEVNGTKVTTASARAYMLGAAVQMFTVQNSKIDQPKIEASIEFQNLGDTEEYSAYKDLENCFLYDYVNVIDQRHEISVQAQIIKIEWDVMLGRMKSVEIGTPSPTVASCIKSAKVTDLYSKFRAVLSEASGIYERTAIDTIAQVTAGYTYILDCGGDSLSFRFNSSTPTTVQRSNLPYTFTPSTNGVIRFVKTVIDPVCRYNGEEIQKVSFMDSHKHFLASPYNLYTITVMSPTSSDAVFYTSENGEAPIAHSSSVAYTFEPTEEAEIYLMNLFSNSSSFKVTTKPVSAGGTAKDVALITDPDFSKTFSIAGFHNEAPCPITIDTSEIDTFGGTVSYFYSPNTSELTITASKDFYETTTIMIPVHLNDLLEKDLIETPFRLYSSANDPTEESMSLTIDKTGMKTSGSGKKKVYNLTFEASVFQNGILLSDSEIAQYGRIAWYSDNDGEMEFLDYGKTIIYSVSSTNTKIKIIARLER